MTNETKRLTASEMECMMRMKAASMILRDTPVKMEQRSSMVPYAKRDFAMLAAKTAKLHDAFMETIPEKQRMTYERNLCMSNFCIGVKMPGPQERDNRQYGMWISYDVLNTLLEACHDHCMMYMLDKGQRRACKLKKAVDVLPNDIVRHDEDDCPYFGVI